MNTPLFSTLVLVCAFVRAAAGQTAGELGVFSEQSDVGLVRYAGEAQFDAAAQAYVISGSGANMWFSNDALHFVWKKVSGDLNLSADIRFLDTNREPHRKACLLIRQSLDADSPYVDVALHGNGLACLQFREEKGATTGEIQSGVSGPARLSLQKRGDYVTLSLAAPGESLRPNGAAIRLPMQEPFYVGLGVCAHDANAVAKAEFAHVELESLPASSGVASNGGSTLEVVPIGSKDRRVIYHTTNLIEAPNWARDGKNFIFNSRGHLYKLPVAGGDPEMIDTGSAHRCNNDHGLSPDGTQLAISDQSENGKSLIYLLPIAGGAPRRITATGPSYWHGWSPDGATLAFCGERNGEFDVYTVPAAGGEETRLTTAPGLDDGPDYSPDGAFIYFNSERSGRMQIWRMKPDGSQQEQITSDDNNNWFAHPSPNGKWIVFLTYGPTVTGHPANQDVALRLMPVAGGKIEVLAKLFGGQGTINVPSWSPDSKEVAFVSYLPTYHHKSR